MALMKSIDGRLYNVPDEQAARFLIPADKVAETLKAAGVQIPTGAGQPSTQPGQVQAYHHWGYHHHCHPGWWGGFVVAAPYNNYYNYQNYYNYYGW